MSAQTPSGCVALPSNVISEQVTQFGSSPVQLLTVRHLSACLCVRPIIEALFARPLAPAVPGQMLLGKAG